MNIVPKSCDNLFRDAGWSPGRRADCRVEGFERNAATENGVRLLEEFGGLSVGQCGAGRDCATSDIRFAVQVMPADRFGMVELELVSGESLFPIGNAHLEHGILYVDSQSRIHMYGIPDGSLRLVGNSFEDAVERLLLGHRLLSEDATS